MIYYGLAGRIGSITGYLQTNTLYKDSLPVEFHRFILKTSIYHIFPFLNENTISFSYNARS